MGKFLARVFRTFGEQGSDEVPGVLYSDSESSLKLLRNRDTPKRSRHLEIRIEWMKARISSGQLVLAFRKGKQNPSDLLTKCLGSAAFNIHRESLGFESLTGPLASLSTKQVVLIEVCCRAQSKVMLACCDLNVAYVGVTEDLQSDRVYREVLDYVMQFGRECTFVHVSTPCSSGSPLTRFSGATKTRADWEWYEVFPCVLRYMKLGKHSSFELPWSNEIWRYDLCQRTLTAAKHEVDVPVRLCMTGMRAKDGLPIGKVLVFPSSSKDFVAVLERFSQCKTNMQICIRLVGMIQVFTLRLLLKQLFKVLLRRYSDCRDAL